MKILPASRPGRNDHLVLLAAKDTDWKKIELPEEFLDLIRSQLRKEITQITLPSPNRMVFVVVVETKEAEYKSREAFRKAGFRLLSALNRHKIETITIRNHTQHVSASLDFAEGLSLGNYQFLRFRKEADSELHSLKEIRILEEGVTKADTDLLQTVTEAVYLVRDLVNTPANYLNAKQLSEAIENCGRNAGFKTQVFNKSKITALKMGGLLAVNQGSVDPPTFTIMEYLPKNAANKKPIVLVGKGVVYDTGGLSLKPTSSMDTMKCDMAGAATMLGVMYCAAKSKLPLHLIALVPATDNRPGGNAFAPGDVITMHNGLTVEMLNSDAEGRMILADALSFARQYKPELVIDAATLTGAAHRAVGDHAITYFTTAGGEVAEQLEECGRHVYERLIAFPLWEEYDEMLKSDIADLKNIGGQNAGAITAAKFLERFTDYPWIHLDIAGIAFFSTPMGYKGKNATAIGLRLLFRFLQQRAQAGKSG